MTAAISAQPAPQERVAVPGRLLATTPMRLFVLTPLLEVAALVAVTGGAALLARTGAAGAAQVATALVSGLTTFAFSAAAVLARLLLAREDHRALRRLGVASPMPWGWGLLAVVYLIGRGSVLRRATGGGALLTWVGLGIAALALVLDRSPLYEQVFGLLSL